MGKSIALSCGFMSNLRVRMLKNRKGTDALLIIISMLCKYDEKSNCIPMSEETIFRVAESANSCEESVKDVLDEAIMLDIFKAVDFFDNVDGNCVHRNGLFPNKELCTGLWKK